MADYCVQCSRRSQAPLTTIPGPFKARPGDVCTVYNTSVKLPFVDKIVEAMEKLGRGQPAPSQMTSRLSELRSPSIITGKAKRPCVVLSDEGNPDEAGKICIMGTFEGTDAGNLPSMYRDFAVPVLPNRGIKSSPPPIHSCPVWNLDYQWIIALPIDTKSGPSQDLERWRSDKMPRGAHLGPKALEDLEQICLQKSQDWEERSWDKSFVKKAYREIVRKRKLNPTIRSRENTVLSSDLPSSINGYQPFRLGPPAGSGSITQPIRRLADDLATTQNGEPVNGEPSFSDAGWPALPQRIVSGPPSQISNKSRATKEVSLIEAKSVPSDSVEKTTKQMSKLKLTSLRSPLSLLRKSSPSPRSISSNRVPSLRAVPCDPPISEIPENPGWTIKVDAARRRR
ncbi:hypothetical protein B0H11DRAFT_1814194 [Mycena galericulata]|nr:hypothetical protein B0H11DRAFT_1814194 [Mycena galericulata]